MIVRFLKKLSWLTALWIRSVKETPDVWKQLGMLTHWPWEETPTTRISKSDYVDNHLDELIWVKEESHIN